MCGIAGVLSEDSEERNLERVRTMCETMTHRGPNEVGFFLGTGVALGIRRLSIIDVANGHQPVYNEDRTVQAVMNGEIYNYKALRKELEARGHRFRSGSDTETIVHLYEEYGDDLVQHLRGMFALALWDDRRKRLLVARDRLGIKPLYYTTDRGRLIFASELKAILQLAEADCGLNWNSVNYLLTFLCTPTTESIVAGVQKLQPGHLMTMDRGGDLRVRRYWTVNFAPNHRLNETEIVERLRDLLMESVRLHQVSDVPVGALLSGGVDSSAVAAAMAWQTGQTIKTFTIGFRDSNFDESCHARRTAAIIGTDHHELILEPDVSEHLDDIVWHLDEPFGDSSAIPTFMVLKLAAEQVTVVLSGDGGDELFAGYDRYRVESRERNYRHIPRPIRKCLGQLGTRMPEGATGRNFLRHIALDGATRYIDSTSLFSAADRRQLFRPQIAQQVEIERPGRELEEYQCRCGGHWLSRLQQLDLAHYLPLDILTKVDRMSMAHSLEARVPLLDHVLVEFAATIPAHLQMSHGVTKSMFKRAVRGLLPDEILERPKRGFAVPLGAWFRGKLEGTVREVLLSERSRRRGVFETGYIEQLLRLHARGRPLDLQLWTLMSFELWCRTFLDKASSRTAAVVERVRHRDAAAQGVREAAGLAHA